MTNPNAVKFYGIVYKISGSGEGEYRAFLHACAVEAFKARITSINPGAKFTEEIPITSASEAKKFLRKAEGVRCSRPCQHE